MKNTKAAIIKSAVIEKIQMAVGVMLLIIFGVCTIMALFQKELASDGFLPFCIVMDVLAFILILFSVKRKQSVQDFKRYVAFLSADPTGSIPVLAAAVGESEKAVKKKLDVMIKRKFFVDAVIDERRNCLLIAEQYKKPEFTMGEVSVPASGPDAQETGGQEMKYVSCVCGSCAGVNQIVKGKEGKCAFCGSPIR